MDFINDILLTYTEPSAQRAGYNMAGVWGEIAFWIVVLYYIVRLRLHPIKTPVVAWLGFAALCRWHTLVLVVQSGFQDWITANLAVSFVYMPLFAWLFAKLFRMPYYAVSELYALGTMAFHMFGRAGCIFPGCCYGIPCEWGIYSHLAGTYVFPVQLVESAMTLAIFLFLLIRTFRKGHMPDGKAMPWMLLLYGVGRFITEFFRDNEKIWFGCSDIAFHALFMAVVGLVMLLFLRKKQSQNEETPPEQV